MVMDGGSIAGLFPGAAGPASVCAACPLRGRALCRTLRDRHVAPALSTFPRTHHRAAGALLFQQGEPFDDVLVVRRGWAMTFKLFEDGDRRIVRFALPGSLLGIEGDARSGMTFGAEAVTDLTVCAVRKHVFFESCAVSAQLALAYADEMTGEAVAAWGHVGALGHRSARERIINLLLDLHRRAVALGEDGGGEVHLPISQIHIADATGLTPVHVSRSLKRMRLDGLLDFRKGTLRLLDPERLAALGQLDPQVHIPGHGPGQAPGHRAGEARGAPCG